MKYQALPTIALVASSDYFHRPTPPEVIHLEDPALDALVDFKIMFPVTVSPRTSISAALIDMKVGGVHLLLVTDEKEKVVGLISSEDILGEKPVKIIQERRLSRNDIEVAAIMTPQQKIIAFDRYELRYAKVGDIIETLHKYQQHYALVVEVNTETQQQTVCGLFSSHRLSKQLGQDITSDISSAHSLAELQHKSDQ